MELKSITRKSGISLVGFNRVYSISIGRSCDQLNFHTINSSLAAELAIKSLLRNLILHSRDVVGHVPNIDEFAIVRQFTETNG